MASCAAADAPGVQSAVDGLTALEADAREERFTVKSISRTRLRLLYDEVHINRKLGTQSLDPPFRG